VRREGRRRRESSRRSPAARSRSRWPRRRALERRRRPKLAIGDQVQVRADHVPGHVRMPAYIRGKRGVVVGISPPYPFPDAQAHGVAAEDEPTYDVRFASSELWPDAAEAALVHAGRVRELPVSATIDAVSAAALPRRRGSFLLEPRCSRSTRPASNALMERLVGEFGAVASAPGDPRRPARPVQGRWPAPGR
jgi:hypothetical protein